MKAVVVEQLGGPEVLTLAEWPAPQPEPGQLLVQVAAAGVNFMDVYQRQGLGSYRTDTPFVPGAEGAGTVVAVGDPGDADGTGPAVGDLVAWAGVGRSYAAQAVVPADRAVRVPPGVDARVAAAVMLQGLTAHYLCTSTYAVRPGDVAVVHAAAGGVGLLLTQMIKRLGGVVIGTTSGGAKGDLAREAGADHVTGYAGFRSVVADVTGGQGAHVVYDGVGKDTFDDSLAALRPRGTMVLLGASSGPVPPFDPQRLNSGGSLYLTRPTLAHYIADRAELERRAAEVLGWVADGGLSVRIGGTYPLADAARAHEDLTGRRTTGKLLLIP
ncbi:MAG TPA: quinone oxidoreductase [Streptosporangiaceae bacterium]|jgi:NADPH:quinone reductase|nr:quinone oxidoreductase [Streptosporangiaceae bacterium]